MAQPAYLGVTPPISTSPPTARECEITVTLHAELEARGIYEGPEEGRTREQVLGRLNTLAKQFVYQSSLNHGLSDAKAREAGGTIFTSGSYRLGVHGPGADIDALLVVPKHVEREEFTTLFEDMLKRMEGVSEVASVPDAYVPIIKCIINGIEMDLLFARLALPTIPDSLDLRDNSLLKNLDERCVRSLGGNRVTDEILRLVPDVPVFREALRTIKLWAKKRGIYRNVVGFLGGVAYAMLVARICQLYPKGNAGSIIARFFTIYQQWNWPQPILLKNIEEGPLQVRVWNPKLYPADRAHRMPIITPAYPAMCSTHNVSKSTHSIMTEEFKRGADVVNRVIMGSAQWSELFADHEFFTTYKHYLQVTASSMSAEAQLKWSGTVESRLRQLVLKLEFVETLIHARPYVKGFDRITYCVDEEEQRAILMGGPVSEVVAARTGKEEDAEKEGRPEEGWREVHSTSYYIGLMIEKALPGANGARKLDISYPSQEFTKLVKMLDTYDEGTMAVTVKHMKGTSLPLDVFEGKPPVPAVKTKGTKRSKTKKLAAELEATPTPAPEDGDERPIKKARSESVQVATDTFIPRLRTPDPQELATPDLGIAAV
ncbi:poly(A) polymerase Pla1 [Pseudohyphozyma bogoriensis]|nr:poly(A) polymerase Pla1 [Pseudohyphozyma bogoriensis]